MKGIYMKKIILLSLCLFLGACAGYDLQQAMRPESRNIYQKLPNMEPIFEAGKALETDTKTGTSGTTSVQLNNEFATLFRREVEKNLINEDGPVKGKLVLEPVYFKREYNTAWILPSAFSLYILNLLGMPAGSDTSKWELELNVLDKNGKRIKRYSAEAENTEYFAAYWGTYNPYQAAVFEGYKKALDDIIKQLQADIPTLSAQLK